MEYRRLGQSGLKISALSLGSWVTFGRQVEGNLALKMMETAYAAGVNFFDNAEFYEYGESERIMGEALRELKWERDSYVISSKVFFGSKKDPWPTQRGLNRKHVFDACHQALERFGVEYLDLYFCHRPDPDTPIGETVRAMHDLIQQGKVMYWGTSEWSAAEIREAYDFAIANHLVPPSMEQPQYNLLEREKVEHEYAELYRDFGMGTTIWSPLASGMLTGKYLDGVPEDSRINLTGYAWLKDLFTNEEGQAKLEKVRSLKKLADELEVSLTDLSLAWCLKNPNVSTVILGASKIEQLESNLKCLELTDILTEGVMAKIDAIFS